MQLRGQDTTAKFDADNTVTGKIGLSPCRRTAGENHFFTTNMA
jgi:hypothetical protein